MLLVIPETTTIGQLRPKCCPLYITLHPQIWLILSLFKKDKRGCQLVLSYRKTAKGFALDRGDIYYLPVNNSWVVHMHEFRRPTALFSTAIPDPLATEAFGALKAPVCL